MGESGSGWMPFWFRPNRASRPGRSQFRSQFAARLQPVAAAVPHAHSPRTCAISRA